MDAAQEALAVARVRSWLRSGRARAVRERAGLSQADVGKAVGTDHAQMSRWESGAHAPEHGSALKLAVLYDGLEEIIRAEEAPADREIPA
jgi:transcriptional regulator with XRE-family HTH domain